MKKRTTGLTRTCAPSVPNETSSWALFTVALVAAGGSADPVFAADPAVNDPSIQVAQAGPSTSRVSPGAQNGPRQATPPVAGTGNGGAATYTIAPPPSANTPYALADQMKVRGWIVPTPNALNTLDQG